MVNLLRYKLHADYGDRADAAPCSGGKLTIMITPRLSELAADGVMLFWLGTVLARVVGPPDEQWDKTSLVKCLSFTTFRNLIESPAIINNNTLKVLPS